MRRILLGFTCVAAAAFSAPVKNFKDSFVRYLSGQDYARVWRQKFPHVPHSVCFEVRANNRDLIGASSPVTGSPFFKTPSPSFVKWYLKCLSTLVEAELSHAESQPEGLLRFLGSRSPLAHNARSIQWTALATPSREAITLHLISEFIGPGIVREETLVAKRIDDQLQKTNQLSVRDAIAKAIKLIASREEFLTY